MHTVARLQMACRLYPRVVRVIEQIIASEGKLNDAEILRRLGYSITNNWPRYVWRDHPHLSEIIFSYRRLMSSKHPLKRRSRNSVTVGNASEALLVSLRQQSFHQHAAE